MIETNVMRSPSKRSREKSQAIPTDYLEILGSRAPDPATSSQTVANNHDTDLEEMIKDKQVTLEKAMKAASDGNAEDAAFLFRLHSRMIIPARNVKSNISSTIISAKEQPVKEQRSTR